MIRVLAASLLAVATVAACAGASASPSSSDAGADLLIFAAASLTQPLDAVEAAYESSHPGVRLTLSLDSSAALRTQIEQGAPADVFLSADATNPKKLVGAGLADGGPVTFAHNRLTVIVAASNPAGIMSSADLARTGVKIIAAGDEVPITKYATQLVGNLAKVAGYPPDFAAAYTSNIASREDNVKAVVAKIELGEGDAGIVYVTDARASTIVATVPVPESANVPVTYDGVIVKASRNAAAGRAFLEWFAGPDGQAILSEFGFLPPS